jgi:N-sulfoglucosamine sulfohydrolase
VVEAERLPRRQFLKTALGSAAFALVPQGLRASSPSAGRLNILVITADDMNWDTPGCQGSRVGDVTPNIDSLARQGMRFAHAHVTISICLPSRSVLVTGRYPHRNGAIGFGHIRADVPLVTDLLRQEGYRVGNLGKVDHLQPQDRFAWDLAPSDEDLGLGRNPEAFGRYALDFFRDATRRKRPFFLLANSHDPHRPLHGTRAEEKRIGDQLHLTRKPSRVYAPDEIPVPGFLPDLPEVRNELAGYYSSSRRCDDTVGALLAALNESGRADDTLVVFLSDNGMAFPFAKSNCYLHSTRVPWIVRWPGCVPAGRVDREHLISGIDLLPTLLESAGIRNPAGIDGRSFFSLLGGEKQSGRDRVVTVFHQNFRGHSFEMRAIQDRSHGYLYNAWSDGKAEFAVEASKSASMRAMRRAMLRDSSLAQRVDFYERRVPEELYDFARDPDALDNRIWEADSRSVREELREWMAATDDPLAPTFTQHLTKSR